MSKGRSRSRRGSSTKPITLAVSCSKAGSSLDEPRPRELPLEVARKAVRIVAEQNGADALVARGDQHQAERAFADGEFDLRVGAAGAELIWRHAERLRRGRVEAAVGIEARAVDRRGHRGAAAKLLAHALASMRGGVGLGRHAQHRLEHAMEVIGAQAHGCGEIVELGLRLGRLDQAAGLLSPSRRVAATKDGSFGLQRLQGLKPARSASAAVA